MNIDFSVCKIREWRREDEKSLAHHANNRNIWLNLRDRFPSPYQASDARRFIKSVLLQQPLTTFAIEVDSEAAGGIGIVMQEDVNRKSAEIGYWLGEAYWGRGITTLAVRAMTEYAFANFPLVRIYAFVFEWNTASMRVLEKAGYIMEARLRRSAIKDGQIIDEFLYALVRE
jgi:[ribosomal protein S5]-alanine N-acetyltransferase